jgi:murein DD-endopeptidase MepM/ murein hydrolase activator NlpD
MALPESVASPTRIGKAVFAFAIGSACVTLMFASLRPVPHADDDAPSTASAAHDADALRASRPGDAPPAPAKAAPVAPPEPRGPRTESVTIDSTFGEAMQRLGIDASVTALLAHSFAGQIDFRRDLRKGDKISLILDDAHAAPKEPLAVRITRRDEDHDLFLHRDLKGKPFYYTANGKSGTPSFSRYPLAFTRVSSNFAKLRLDPVTHRWQSHDGVDLAAPVGTPVHATARGTISFIGREGGYGKFIVIDNAPPYQTAFAHLSRFAKGLHRGSHVKRGQVIGYVGMTGWSTGPHLHYEVRVNEVAKNPLTVALPGDTPLHGEERKRFAQEASHLADQL